jgi:tetratricopeptide (TPR) repeat protein
VAGDLFIADDPAWARAVFIKSLSHSEENVTGHPAMFSLSSVACNLSSVGDGERAREFFNKSLELAQGVPEPNIRAGMLCALAGGLWAMEEFDRAREVFKTAMEAARKTLDPFVRTRVLATIAENLARVKERQWAWESFEEAAGAAEKVPAEGARADALAFTAGKLVAVGEAQWAKDIAIKALKALGKSKDVNRGRVEAMASLSTVLAAAGEADQAREVLAGGRELAVGLHDRFESSWAWNALAKSCLVLGEVEAAVELLGKIKDLHAVSDARIACARYLLKRSSGEALDLIAGIPLFFERMRGIADAALDLTRDHLLPESSEAGTLSELTIMSLEDPITSDFVASRWLLQSQERDVLFKAGMEMGRSAQTVDKKAVDG